MPVEFAQPINPNYAYLNGVYQGQQQPEILGIAGLTEQIGPFFIGFDTDLKPAMARIFFDPSQIQPVDMGKPQTIGLMQIGQITYQGIPIPPYVYRMGMQYLQNYVPPLPLEIRDPNYWADMMTPADAAGLPWPMFQWNGLLRNRQYTLDSFFSYPMPNGSFANIPPNFSGPERTSFASSLFDAVNLDMDSPPATVILQYITDMVQRGVEPTASLAVTQEMVLSATALGLAFQMLGIDDAELIESVEVNDPYMLITMVDIEGDGPMYAAFFDWILTEAGDRVEALVIYELDLEEFEELRFTALTETFYNIQQYLLRSGAIPKRGFPADPPPRSSRQGKGGDGLNPFPFVFQGFQYDPEILDEDEIGPQVSFNYETYAMGFTDEKLHCYGAIGWRASRIFDPSVLEFGDLRLHRPQGLGRQGDVLNQAINGQTYPSESIPYQVIRTFRNLVQAQSISGGTNPTFFENTSLMTRSPQGYSTGSQNWTGR